MPRQSFKPRNRPYPVDGCGRLFTNQGGVTVHIRTMHTPFQRNHQTVHHSNNTTDPRTFSPPPMDDAGDTGVCDEPQDEQEASERVECHPFINGVLYLFIFTSVTYFMIGLPCDKDGNYLPEGTPPPPWDYPASDDFFPYDDRASFELADLLYRRNQMPASQINDLLQIWAATQHPDEELPFINKQHIYDTIDATILGDVPWQSFSVEFNGDVSELDHEGAPWKLKSYDVWFRNPRLILHNQLGNRDFAGEIDLCAKRVYDDKNKRWYQNFMSGNWPWRQSVCTCSF